MPRCSPPATIADSPALVCLSAVSAGDDDRQKGTKRASFKPWMSRAAYLHGWRTCTEPRLYRSKWRMRKHWRQCRRSGDVPKKLTRTERRALRG